MRGLTKRLRSAFYKWWSVFGMVMWDILAGIAFLFVLNIALWNMDSTVSRGGIVLASAGIMVVGFVLRYRLLYGKRGIDDVTGGMNKKEFERVCSILLKGEGEFVMVYANIDRFKLINDAYGDDEGDMVLRKIQEVIDDEMLRWDEASGRIMADNFGLLMRFLSMAKLEHRLARINESLAALRDSEGVEYGIKLYFGIYRVEDKSEPVSSMLEKANLALKKLVPSMQHLIQLGVYDEEEKKQLGREKELEMKMERALKNGEFIPYLQPKYELTNETIGGAEALVRWVDPVEGMILPNEFIPLFEKNGFIVELDLYMFEQVCQIVERWSKLGYRKIPISVNMSRGHFTVPGFFEKYRGILSRYDVPVGTIEIELTESLFYNEMSMLKDLINQIHEAGMLCSIDDFGSGYSSLNMLKEVEVDALKLDRVFFDETEDDERSKSVINSVLHLAQDLRLRTISEGVEVRSQVEYLKAAACDYIQGYVFARPMPVADFEKIAFSSDARWVSEQAEGRARV